MREAPRFLCVDAQSAFSGQRAARLLVRVFIRSIRSTFYRAGGRIVEVSVREYPFRGWFEEGILMLIRAGGR
ncbi:hypothetical protein [Lentzea sp. NPDC055074]